MSANTLPEPAASPEAPAVPVHIAKDFAVIEFLKDEVEKSGELYLKVALWKVLLRLPQHCDDMISSDHDHGKEAMKKMLVGLIHYSEQIISAGNAEGGLDHKKHGATEGVVRENIQWLRQKLALLETRVTEPRKEYILRLFDGGKS